MANLFSGNMGFLFDRERIRVALEAGRQAYSEALQEADREQRRKEQGEQLMQIIHQIVSPDLPAQEQLDTLLNTEAFQTIRACRLAICPLCRKGFNDGFMVSGDFYHYTSGDPIRCPA